MLDTMFVQTLQMYTIIINGGVCADAVIWIVLAASQHRNDGLCIFPSWT